MGRLLIGGRHIACGFTICLTLHQHLNTGRETGYFPILACDHL
jgi:hypothetical protein